MSNHRPLKFNSQEDATDCNNYDNNQRIRYMRQPQQQYSQMQLQQATQLQQRMQRMQNIRYNQSNNQNVQYLQVNINNNQFENFVPPAITLRLQPLPIPMQSETSSSTADFIADGGMTRTNIMREDLTNRLNRQDDMTPSSSAASSSAASSERANFAFVRPMPVPSLSQQWNSTSTVGANGVRKLVRRQSVCVSRPTAVAERNIFHMPRHLGINIDAASSSTIAAATSSSISAATSSSMAAASSSTSAAASTSSAMPTGRRSFDELDLTWLVDRNANIQLQQDIQRVYRKHQLLARQRLAEKEGVAALEVPNTHQQIIINHHEEIEEEIVNMPPELVSQENIEEQELNSEDMVIVSDCEDNVTESIETYHEIIDNMPTSSAEFSISQFRQLEMETNPEDIMSDNLPSMSHMSAGPPRRQTIVVDRSTHSDFSISEDISNNQPSCSRMSSMPPRRQTIMVDRNTRSIDTDFLKNLRTARDDSGISAKRFRSIETRNEISTHLQTMDYRLSPPHADLSGGRAYRNNMRQVQSNSDSEGEVNTSMFRTVYKDQYERLSTSRKNNMKKYQSTNSPVHQANNDDYYDRVESTTMGGYKRTYNSNSSPEHDAFQNNNIGHSHSNFDAKKWRKSNESNAHAKKKSRSLKKSVDADADSDCVTFVIYDQGDASPHGAIPKSYHKRLEEEFNKLLAQHLLSDKKSENEHIQLIDSGFVNDFYCVRVSSPRYIKDLQQIVNSLPNLWEGCSFNLMRKDSAEQRFEVTCVLPFASGDLEFTNFVKILQKQNPKINTASWGLNGKKVVKKGHQLRITVDKHSYEVLQEDAPLYFLAYRLNFKIGQLIFQWKSSTNNIHEGRFSDSSEEDDDEDASGKKIKIKKIGKYKASEQKDYQLQEDEYDDHDADEEDADEEQDADDEQESEEYQYSEEEYYDKDDEHDRSDDKKSAECQIDHNDKIATEPQIKHESQLTNVNRVAAEYGVGEDAPIDDEYHIDVQNEGADGNLVARNDQETAKNDDKEQETDSDKEEARGSSSDSSDSSSSDDDKSESSRKDNSHDDSSDSYSENSGDQEKDENNSVSLASYSGAEDDEKMQEEYLIDQQSGSSMNTQMLEIKSEIIKEEEEEEEENEAGKDIKVENVNFIKKEELDDVNIYANGDVFEDMEYKIKKGEEEEESECTGNIDQTEIVQETLIDTVEEHEEAAPNEILMDEENKQNKENNEPPNSEKENEQTCEPLSINNNKIKLVEIKKLLDSSFTSNMESNAERIPSAENKDDTDCNLLIPTENSNNVLNELLENDTNSPKIDEEKLQT